MTLNQKLSIWMLSALLVWQVSLTDTTNTRQADNARRLIYTVAGVVSFGLLWRKDPK